MPRRAPIEELRAAVDCLPLRTKEAMLHGVRTEVIIVGAYTDRDGGVCPMLAAHRNGGRTSFIAFARAWDRFSGARRARRATRRELRVLEAQLEASILAERDGGLLGATIAEHQALLRRRKSREAARTGLGWLRPVAASGEAVYPASSGGSPTRSTGAQAPSLGNAPAHVAGGPSR